MVVVIDFAGFTKLIDSLGAITVNVEKDLNQKYNVNSPLPTRKVTLNGSQDLQYVMALKIDIERVQGNQFFVKTLYQQIRAKNAYLTEANFVVNNPNVVVTNFYSTELISMARNASKYESYKLETVFMRVTATTIDGM